ncbi:DUF5009 domain-containing protein [Bacteroides thetaiotaomicron]|uniref:alpha amylase family protein n=1 Tax=Bacteroides thetaiotaomicron TaxID=818 RepID=UPI0021664A76|nr:alpha amylase family protein [Bacteroides thetaiotaomicron]MCS2829288.1 DUF5009 domain-containing protein [Bacteroides thetaiotaomicron]
MGGYAELIDLYATGNYYTDITIEEYRKTNRSIWNETDSQAQSGTWYCVEGSCQHLRQILKGNKFMGGILVDQFYDNPAKLSETIEMNLRRSDGLMVFDIVHIITKNLWKEVEEGMKKRRLLMNNRAYALDALRGYAIITMVLSATIVTQVLPVG